MTDSEKCPKCGADILQGFPKRDPETEQDLCVYDCGTIDYGDSTLQQSRKCRDAQIATLTAENKKIQHDRQTATDILNGVMAILGSPGVCLWEGSPSRVANKAIALITSHAGRIGTLTAERDRLAGIVRAVVAEAAMATRRDGIDIDCEAILDAEAWVAEQDAAAEKGT